MKKCTYFFLAFAYLTMLLFVAGCDECKDIDCPQDVEFPDYMEKRIPYQVGQVVRFANANRDTVALTCGNREYTKQTISPNGNVEEECCSNASAEVLTCALGNGNEYLSMVTSFIPTNTDDGGFYVTTYSAKIDGVQYYEDDYDGHVLASVELNNKVFQNVFRIDKDSNFILYNNDGLGVVGFKISGEEWALVS
jgi:hypothetical protein